MLEEHRAELRRTERRKKWIFSRVIIREKIKFSSFCLC